MQILINNTLLSVLYLIVNFLFIGISLRIVKKYPETYSFLFGEKFPDKDVIFPILIVSAIFLLIDRGEISSIVNFQQLVFLTSILGVLITFFDIKYKINVVKKNKIQVAILTESILCIVCVAIFMIPNVYILNSLQETQIHSSFQEVVKKTKQEKAGKFHEVS